MNKRPHVAATPGPPDEALVNGTMARAQDYDAFHERALALPADPVVTA